MYEYERHDDTNEPFQNRDDLNEDPDAPLFH